MTELDAREDVHQAFLASVPVLRFIARRFRVRPEDVDDLLQDVFILFLRDCGIIADRRAWLVGTMANKCRHYCRIRTRHERREATAAPEPAYESPFVAQATAESILRRLSAKDRLVLHLRFVEGYRILEIAARFGTSRSSADKRLRAALKRALRAAGIHGAEETDPARCERRLGVFQKDAFASLRPPLPVFHLRTFTLLHREAAAAA